MDFAKILDYAQKRLEFDWLDFKATFDMDSEKHRAELVKDISALANTVDTEGYLIIGVDCSGEALNLAGFKGNLDDAKLQQIVNSRLNRPVRFTYDLVEHEGKTYGRFTVPYSDVKPHQVTKDWVITENTKNGTEKHKVISQGQVFRREGSSTEPANVEEIIEMSLNAVNDLSKIDEEDLANRVVVLLRRGDHVGIREMLRNAPRCTLRALAAIDLSSAQQEAERDSLFSAYLRRVAIIGFAVIRNRCVECHEDLLRCLGGLYLIGHTEPAVTTHKSRAEVWQNILLLGGYATLRRNWAFIHTLFRHRVSPRVNQRELLFYNPLQENNHEELNAFGRLYGDSRFLEEFDCGQEHYQVALCEYDFLAHLFARQRMGENRYDAKWHGYQEGWVDSFLEEVKDSKEVADLLIDLCINNGTPRVSVWQCERKTGAVAIGFESLR